MSSPILQQIQRLVEDQRIKECSDELLLQKWGVSRDEGCFQALVQRHGPMVLDVCRALLHNEADAEDVFQATFLILARKAGSIRKTTALASWLHGVAYRTALQAQTEFARRRKHETRVAIRVPAREAAGPQDLTWCEVQRVLHEELNRLSERQRAPLVLCYLQGKTQDEAATSLGLAKGMLKGRLERGRALLRERLVRRGLGPAMVLLTSTWPAALASAAVPSSLFSSTVKAASLFAAGQALPAEAISAQAVSLAKAAVQTMSATKLMFVMLLMLAVGGVGVAVFGRGAEREVSVPVPERLRHGDAPADPLPPGAQVRMGTTRFRHGGPVSSMAYLAKGKILASAGHVGMMWDEHTPGKIRFWEAETGKELRQFQLKGNAHLAASPDGTVLAGADGRDGTIYLWDAASGKELHRLKGGKPDPDYPLQKPIVFSPDGKILAAIPFSSEGEAGLNMWDVATGKLLLNKKIDGAGKPVNTIAFSADGRILAYSYVSWQDPTFSANLRFFEIDGWKEIFPFPAKNGICRFAFSPDKTTIAGAEPQNRPDGRGGLMISIHDLATGKLLRQFPMQHKDVTALVFSADGKTLASAGSDKTIRLWEVATGKERQGWSGDEYNTATLAFAPDGNTLAWASPAGLIQVRDLGTGEVLPRRTAQVTAGELLVQQRLIQQLGSLNFAEREAASKALEAIGEPALDALRRAAATTTDAEIRRRAVLLVRAIDRRFYGQQGHQGMISSVALTADGKTLISASSDGTIRIWETATGKELRRLAGHEEPVWGPGFHPRRLISSVLLSPDGKSLSSVSTADETVRIWDLATGNEVQRFPGAKYSCQAAWLPDGKTLIVVGHAPWLHFYDIATGKELFNVGQVESGAVLAVSRDGKMLVSGQTTLHLVETATGKKLPPLPQDSFRTTHVSSAAFLPDGKALLTGSAWDRTIRLSDIATGKELLKFSGHEAGITRLALSPDGSTLASASFDETVRLWDVATGKERRRLQGHQGTVTSLSWSGDGKTLASGSTDSTALVWDVAK